MFIGKDYDNSLWCMLMSDKKNRKRILDLIREIPEEVIAAARRQAKAYEDEEPYDDIDDDFYYQETPNGPKIRYAVTMEEDDGSICITKELVEKKVNKHGDEYNAYQEVYEFTILPLNEDKLDSLEDLEFDDSVGWLASLTFAKTESYDYDIREKKNGYAVRRAKLFLGERVEVPSFTKINLDDIPEDLDVEDVALKLIQH